MPGRECLERFRRLQEPDHRYDRADRQWITSRGSQAWIAYHDSGSSTTVHVQRSDDDGFTWKRVGDPITSNGPTTDGSTFNNDNSPIVADPS